MAFFLEEACCNWCQNIILQGLRSYEEIFLKPSGWSVEQEQRMCFFYDDSEFKAHLDSDNFKLIFKSHPCLEESCNSSGMCGCFSFKRDLKEKSTCRHLIEHESLEAYKSAQKNDFSSTFWVEIELNVGAKISKSFQIIDSV